MFFFYLVILNSADALTPRDVFVATKKPIRFHQKDPNILPTNPSSNAGFICFQLPDRPARRAGFKGSAGGRAQQGAFGLVYLRQSVHGRFRLGSA